MPARLPATNRQPANNRQLAVGRLAASGRLNVSGGGGGGGGGDDMTFLDEVIVGGGGAANITFSAISGAYRHLWIEWVCRGDGVSAVAFQLQFNADTGANYETAGWVMSAPGGGSTDVVVGSQGATEIRIGRICPSGSPAGAFSSGFIDIPYYATTTQSKSSWAACTSYEAAAVAGVFKEEHMGQWTTANAAITQVLIFPSSGNLIENSRASLYGIT